MLSRLWSKFSCWIGYHQWYVDRRESRGYVRRVCPICGDRSYGPE